MVKISLDRFDDVNNQILIDIKNVLLAQGHHFEGELERSFISFALQEGNIIHLRAEASEYINDLEYGIAPQEFDESRVDKEKLQRWVDVKRAQVGKQLGTIIKGGKKKKNTFPSVNRLIQLWKKQGYELGGAITYSKIPQVNGAINLAMENRYKREYVNMIDTEVFDAIDDEFFKIKSGTVK